jgi:hypothetical protein
MQGLSARIASYESWKTCATIIQGAAVFWITTPEKEKDFAWIVVIAKTVTQNKATATCKMRNKHKVGFNNILLIRID